MRDKKLNFPFLYRDQKSEDRSQMTEIRGQKGRSCRSLTLVSGKFMIHIFVNDESAAFFPVSQILMYFFIEKNNSESHYEINGVPHVSDI